MQYQAQGTFAVELMLLHAYSMIMLMLLWTNHGMNKEGFHQNYERAAGHLTTAAQPLGQSPFSSKLTKFSARMLSFKLGVCVHKTKLVWTAFMSRFFFEEIRSRVSLQSTPGSAG